MDLSQLLYHLRIDHKVADGRISVAQQDLHPTLIPAKLEDMHIDIHITEAFEKIADV